jgi:hypothetical protein
VTLTFDSNQREEMRDIAGGRFLSREEFRAAQADAQAEETKTEE